MTNREYHLAVLEDKVTADVKKHASKELEKLDNRNANRSNKPSKVQLENAPIKEAMLKYLMENKGAFTEGELGTALEVTHNKAGALARQLVAEGKAVSSEIKIPKVGKRKVYSLAVSE